MVALVGLEILLSVKDTGPLLFSSFSKLPWPLPCLLFSLFISPQPLVSSAFFNPTHNSERMEEDRVVYFETKFNIDPQKKQPLQYALLPHKRHI